jgi:hypothetical protein
VPALGAAADGAALGDPVGWGALGAAVDAAGAEDFAGAIPHTSQ